MQIIMTNRSFTQLLRTGMLNTEKLSKCRIDTAEGLYSDRQGRKIRMTTITLDSGESVSGEEYLKAHQPKVAEPEVLKSAEAGAVEPVTIPVANPFEE